MKLRVDQNISFRIKEKIAQYFPDTAHVRDLGLLDFPDAQLFDYARKEGFDAILTLDEDFHNLVIEKGTPPKIVWLRTGNCSTIIQAQSILNNSAVIQTFIKDDGFDVLEIYRN